jgi:transposase
LFTSAAETLPSMNRSMGPPRPREPTMMQSACIFSAAWMLLQPERVKDEQQNVVERLCELFPDLKAAQELALEFAKMIRHRAAESLPAWLRAAARSKLKEFVGFARGISEDYGAVRNSLTYEWSNGQLEGQVNRLKLVKRAMYGRASFDLLRARILHAVK